MRELHPLKSSSTMEIAILQNISRTTITFFFSGSKRKDFMIESDSLFQFVCVLRFLSFVFIDVEIEIMLLKRHKSIWLDCIQV